MFNLIEELVAITRVFAEEGIDYAVCGGMAMAIHGYTRATEDIDILVKADDLPRIRKAIQRVGFDTMGRQSGFPLQEWRTSRSPAEDQAARRLSGARPHARLRPV
jgi:hypothetical protein